MSSSEKKKSPFDAIREPAPPIERGGGVERISLGDQLVIARKKEQKKLKDELEKARQEKELLQKQLEQKNKLIQQDESIKDGHSSGYLDGHSSGYPDGHSSKNNQNNADNGHLNGHLNGHSDEYLDGHDGYLDGHSGGYPDNGHLDGHSDGHLDGHSDDHLNGHSDDHLNGHSDGHLDGHSDDHLNGHSDDHLDGHSNGYLDGHSDSHSSGHFDGHSNFYDNIINTNNLNSLTDRQISVFKCLVYYENTPVSYKIISTESRVPESTVKKIVKIFIKDSIISQPKIYKKGKVQGFTFKFNKRIILDKNDGHLDGHSSNTPPSLIRKKERFFLKNLSFSDFWISQGLTQQKLNTWIEEFDLTDEEWVNQLLFGESEPKVKNADNPINYFYKSLKKGGLTRPEGFEFPEERRQRIQAENMKARQAVIEKAEKLREQEKELADKEAFMELLKDKESIEHAIAAFEHEFKIHSSLKIAVAQFHRSGAINTILENRLKRWFRQDSV